MLHAKWSCVHAALGMFLHHMMFDGQGSTGLTNDLLQAEPKRQSGPCGLSSGVNDAVCFLPAPFNLRALCSTRRLITGTRCVLVGNEVFCVAQLACFCMYRMCVAAGWGNVFFLVFLPWATASLSCAFRALMCFAWAQPAIGAKGWLQQDPVSLCVLSCKLLWFHCKPSSCAVL